MYDDTKAAQLAEARRKGAENRAKRASGELPPLAPPGEKAKALAAGARLTIAAYARHRGNDAKTVRQAIAEGRVAEAIDAGGFIDPIEADRLWAERATRYRPGKATGDAPLPPSMTAAKKRKAIANVARLEREVGALRSGLITPAQADRIIDGELRPVATRLRQIPLAIAETAAGQTARDAAIAIQNAVNEALADITNRASEAPSPAIAPAKPAAAAVLSAVELEITRTSLLAERQELLNGRSSGELLPIGDVVAALDVRLSDARGGIMSLAGRVAPRCKNADSPMVEAILATAIEPVVSELLGPA